METCPAQAVLPLVGLAADKITRDWDICQAVERVRMETCPAQAVLPLVGLAADKITRDWDIMQYEVENKYRVSELSSVRQQLTELGAQFQGAVEQVDIYFSHPVRDFATTDEALRLRQVGEHNWITYKGPKIDHSTKTRREIELPLASGAELVEAYTSLLAALGFGVVARVPKKRRHGWVQWQEWSVDVSLDDVLGVGQFVELEIVADAEWLSGVQSAVVALADQLGLVNPERRSYLEMLLEADSP